MFLGKYDIAKFIVIAYKIGVDSEKRHKIVSVAVFIAFFNSLITQSIKSFIANEINVSPLVMYYHCDINILQKGLYHLFLNRHIKNDIMQTYLIKNESLYNF